LNTGNEVLCLMEEGEEEGGARGESRGRVKGEEGRDRVNLEGGK